MHITFLKKICFRENAYAFELGEGQRETILKQTPMECGAPHGAQLPDP